MPKNVTSVRSVRVMGIRRASDFLGITRPKGERVHWPPLLYLGVAIFSAAWVVIGLMGPWPTWFVVLWAALTIISFGEWLWLRKLKR
jgi:hypothetical protein